MFCLKINLKHDYDKNVESLTIFRCNNCIQVKRFGSKYIFKSLTLQTQMDYGSLPICQVNKALKMVSDFHYYSWQIKLVWWIHHGLKTINVLLYLIHTLHQQN